jgi:hypothetical protein
VSKCLSPLHKSFCNSIVCTFTVLCACRSTSLGRKKKNAKKQHWVRHKRRLTRSLTFTSLSFADDQHFASICTKLQISPAPRGGGGYISANSAFHSVRLPLTHSLYVYICAVGLTSGSVGEWSACYSTRAYTSSSSVCVRVHILSRSSQSAVNNSEFNYWASGGGVFGCANHPRRALRHLHAARFNLLYAP